MQVKGEVSNNKLQLDRFACISSSVITTVVVKVEFRNFQEDKPDNYSMFFKVNTSYVT
jgi:hypothetical protein